MRRLIGALLLVALSALPQGVWAAAITVNATGTTQATAAASPRTDTSLTIASGSDIYLVCVAETRDAITGLAMTWNSVSLTQLNVQAQASWPDEQAFVFGLASPATGNQTLSASWSSGGSPRFSYRCIAFNNVGSVSGTLTNSSGTTDDPSATITTASGDATVSVGSFTAGVDSMGLTSLFSNSNHGSAQYTLSTDTDDAHSYVTDAAFSWGIAGVRLLQTSAAAETFGFRLRVIQ